MKQFLIYFLLILTIFGCKKAENSHSENHLSEKTAIISSKKGSFIIDDGKKFSIIDRNGKNLKRMSKEEFLNKNGKELLWKDKDREISKHAGSKALCKVFKMPEKFVGGYEIIERDSEKILVDSNLEKVLTLKNNYMLRAVGDSLVVLEGFAPNIPIIILDNKGNVIAGREKNYYKVFELNDGIIRIMKHENGKSFFGFINEKGKVVIDFRYEIASNFFNGIATVKKGKVWRVIDKKGSSVAEFKDYWNLKVVDSKNFLAETADSRYFHIKLSDNKVSPMVFKKVKVLEKCRILIGFDSENEMQLLNREGRIVSDRIFEEIIEDSAQIIRLKTDGKWGVFIKENEKLTINPKYSNISQFQDDRAVAYKDGKPLIINSSGNIVLELKNGDRIRSVNDLAYCR